MIFRSICKRTEALASVRFFRRWKIGGACSLCFGALLATFPARESNPPEARTSRFHHHSPPEQKPAGDSPRLSPAQSSKSLTEFAALGPRIKSNPFFAAACTSQKTLCAESECRRLAKASQGTERNVNFFSKRARLFWRIFNTAGSPRPRGP